MKRNLFLAALALCFLPRLLLGADQEKSQDVGALVREIEQLRSENERLKRENEDLRQRLERKAEAAPSKEGRAAKAGTRLQPKKNGDPAGAYWLSNSGKRHNKKCRYYNGSQGRPCGPGEGTPCKLCGG
jgi:hypothetical protein